MSAGTDIDTTVDLTEPRPEAAPPHLTHAQLFIRFLRFGLLAWGGPVAQIAMVRRELVDDERWISSERFNRLLAVMQVLPGPEAHELCVHLGMRAKGRLGGILAGLGFMLPGFLLMMALSWLYFRIALIDTALGAAFLGIQAAVIALIVAAVHRIGKHILLDGRLWMLAIICGLAAFAGAPFWITLPASGAIYALWALGLRVFAALVAAGATALTILVMLLAPDAATPEVQTAIGDPGQAPVWLLFVSGLKAGLLTFGGAYTAIPFVRNDAVGQGWMNDGQFLDGLALSGILPAPLIIFATFVGYFGGGPLGAVAMTVGIFLPAFAFSLILYDRLESVLEAKRLHAFLAGVSAGVVGLIAATTIDLATVTAQRVPDLIIGVSIFAVALALLYTWKNKLNVVVALAAAGLAGWVFFAPAS